MHAAGLAGPRIDSFAHMKDLSPLPSFSKVQSFGITPTATRDPAAAATAAAAAVAGMGGMVNDASGGAGGAAAVRGLVNNNSNNNNNNDMTVPTTTATTMLPPSGSGMQSGGSGNSHLTPRGLGRQDSGVSTGEGDNPGGSGGARPIKRSRRASETVGDGSGGGGLPVNEFEGVDLAGISRKFPQARVVGRWSSASTRTHSTRSFRSFVFVRLKTALV